MAALYWLGIHKVANAAKDMTVTKLSAESDEAAPLREAKGALAEQLSPAASGEDAVTEPGE